MIFHYNSHEPENVALKSAEFEKIELKLSICSLSLLKVKRRALKLLKSAHFFIPLPYIFSFKLLLLKILTCATLEKMGREKAEFMQIWAEPCDAAS